MERVELPVLRVAAVAVLVVRVDVGRVAVALVERVAVAVVLELPAILAGVAVEVEREDAPERLTASERLTAVFVLPYVRLLVGADAAAAPLDALMALCSPPAVARLRALEVLRISRAFTMPVLRLENERSG